MTSIVNLYFLIFPFLILYKPISSQNVSSRIINGIAAKPGQFPFAVFLHTWAKKNREKLREVRCTGTIITDQWVVSGAHCYRLYPELNDIVTKVTAGTIDIYETHSSVQVRMSRRFAIHPLDKKVQKKREFYNKDVILIEVDKRFHFNEYLDAIRLARSPFPYTKSLSCLMVGFGWLDPDNKMLNTRLFYTKTHINGSCKQKRFQTGVWTQANLCMKPTYNVPCRGDSGGPLVCEGLMVGTFCGMWNLNWNQSPEEPPCNLEDNFFIYTFLGYFEKWIRTSVSDLPETRGVVGSIRLNRDDVYVSRGSTTRALFVSIGSVVIGVVMVHG